MPGSSWSPEPLVAAVQGGDEGRVLRALRDNLAARLDACESDRDYATLTARMTDVLARLDALPGSTKGTALDELARRRAAGDGAAARPLRPGSRHLGS